MNILIGQLHLIELNDEGHKRKFPLTDDGDLSYRERKSGQLRIEVLGTRRRDIGQQRIASSTMIIVVAYVLGVCVATGSRHRFHQPTLELFK